MSELITKEMEIPAEGFLDFTTDRLKGKINYILVLVNNHVNIKISTQTFDDFVIYENHQLMGSAYLPIRLRPIDWRHEGFNYSHVRIKINDGIRFKVEGLSGTKLQAVIDWDKDNA